jgi:hypothetical protein
MSLVGKSSAIEKPGTDMMRNKAIKQNTNGLLIITSFDRVKGLFETKGQNFDDQFSPPFKHEKPDNRSFRDSKPLPRP